MKEEIREEGEEEEEGKPDPAIKSILSFGFSSLPHCFRRTDNMQFEDGGSFDSPRYRFNSMRFDALSARA